MKYIYMAANFKGIELNCAPEWKDSMSLKMAGKPQMETNGQVEILALWGLSSTYGELANAIVSLRESRMNGCPRESQVELGSPESDNALSQRTA